jgi:hypothetical protein
MKKAISFLIGILIVSAIFAQDTPSDKKFRVVANLGLTESFGQNHMFGFLFSLKPQYSLSNHFRIGIVGETSTVGGGTEALRMYDVISIVPVIDYYFYSNKIVKPFIGLGVGCSKFDYSNRSNTIKLLDKKHLCTVVSAGIDKKRLNLSVNYNVIKAPWNDYISLKVGVIVGGGKRKDK